MSESQRLWLGPIYPHSKWCLISSKVRACMQMTRQSNRHCRKVHFLVQRGHLLCARQTALETQDLCCTYLAHYELESQFIIIVIIVVVVVIIVVVIIIITITIIIICCL